MPTFISVQYPHCHRDQVVKRGKTARGTQKIERLVRRNICFSKSTRMHDIVIGLFVNRYAFGRPV